MKKLVSIGENRLSKILATDKNLNPERYISLLKSDVKSLFSNYMQLEGEVDVEIYEEDGEFKIEVFASASRMKNLGMLP